jgi:hypothetical protein
LTHAHAPRPGRPRRGIGPGRWLALIALGLAAAVCLLYCVSQARVAVTSRPQLGTAQLELPVASAWQARPVTRIFPATLDDGRAGVTWSRVAIASPAPCAAALAAGFTGSGTPCRTVLRATYTDLARSMAATIAIIVQPPAAGDAEQLDSELSGDELSGQVVMPVRVSPVPGTAAATWDNAGRIGMDTEGLSPRGAYPPGDDYTVVTETGSLDGRTAGNLPAHWAGKAGGDKHDRDGWQLPAVGLADLMAARLSTLL